MSAPRLLALLLSCSCVAPALAGDVTTDHYDSARTGLNADERLLTPAIVSAGRFGKLFSRRLDGAVYAQPLYLKHLALREAGVHDVVLVATEADSVYALDAGEGSPLWRASLLDVAHGAAPGAAAVDAAALRCPAVAPQVGITSTPVVDRKAGALFVEAYSKEGDAFVHRLHALDLATGAERPPGPVVVAATAGPLVFDPAHHLGRPGLLLSGGVVYAAFSSHCDHPPAHGWVFAYDAATLRLKDALVTTPEGEHGGVWMSGAGLAADEAGAVFLATGNGSVSERDVSQSLLRLDLRAGRLVAGDRFTPANHALLTRHDQDLGSGGVVLLPDQPGPHPHLLVHAGKEGRICLLDRDRMAAPLQELPEALEGMLFGTPAYWNGALYFAAAGDVVRGFRLRDGRLVATPFSVGKDRLGYPGAGLAVSADGTSHGILWALHSNAIVTEGAAVLRAYDAADLSRVLYASDAKPERDGPGTAVKFAVPTVVNGKVYVGTAEGLSVYGVTP
jgi:outer membrane protein assembly factor BamB